MKSLHKDLLWQDLYGYLESPKACNFRRIGLKTDWKCRGTLQYTKRFCRINKLDTEQVVSECYRTDGHCDCKVLFNTAEEIPKQRKLPKRADSIKKRLFDKFTAFPFLMKRFNAGGR